jgi:hypothetical protein
MSPNTQWWRSFVVHLYRLQNDFNSACCNMTDFKTGSSLDISLKSFIYQAE